MSRRAALAAVGVAAAALAASSVATAGSDAVRVVDRTLECATGYHGGARVIFLRAQAAYGQGDRLDWLAGVYVSTAGQPIPSRPNYRPSLAGVNAGWPPPPPLTSGGLGFDTRRCVPSRAKVDLARRGLVGGAASQLGDDYTCVVPRRIVVRVRATFRQPVDLKTARSLATAEGRIERGEIAITTLAGKPLVYGEVREAGAARLFTTGRCG